jgi:uncharacterized membrane protein YqjE
MGLFGEARSIVDDVKGLASTGLRAVRTRLELLVIELAEEKAWIARFVMVAVAALYLVTFGLALAICALVLWSSEENRPAILACFAAAFLAIGGGGLAYIYLASRKRRPALGETIAILKGDETALRQDPRGAGDEAALRQDLQGAGDD